MNNFSNTNSIERRIILKKINPLQPHIPALFLDRDGVLIDDKHYLSDPDDVKLCKGSSDLINHANSKGWHVVIITNQSGISRGYFNWSDYEKVTNRMLRLLDNPKQISAIYANGHGPEASLCSWRKPSPSMILEASRELRIDLVKSILIGDRLSDLKSGFTAGIGTLAHVLTGHGANERALVEDYQSELCFKKSIDNAKTFLFLDSLLCFPLGIINDW